MDSQLAAICSHAFVYVTVLFVAFFSEMGEYRRSEAGQGGSAETFYKTTLEPADWWKWFKSDYKEKEGWTEVLHY